ncbi:MAG: aminomethyl-transferring glycine dehydrogenase subunit GcvPB [Aigarchaeota archaeon]|nr:aminomethyl-transferring glycine dehydrogenase subunit GcvPB [Aigarchaeota archaeon]MDW8092407.1 aminomethyl-transferring glycine dehydrogenase subunit GcvPB [Nitrososphaerota archaeon]
MRESSFRQARWDEPLIFEMPDERPAERLTHRMDDWMRAYLERALRKLGRLPRSRLAIPDLSELTVLRHFTRLSQMNFSVSTGIYPLGSCTMKYNPLVNEVVSRNPRFTGLHPLQDSETVQGALEVLYRLERLLCKVTGMDRFTFATSAGAHAEFAACLIMRRYFSVRGDRRSTILIPDSAHGTNPASATMAGFKVEVIESDKEGCVDLRRLREAVNEDVAGMMMTNPNTLGIFERNIKEIVKTVHDSGGLLYYDGANLNAIMGLVRPGDMGFDIVHLNLHKTFSTPHGGGGPGAGPLGVKLFLEDYLPIPVVSHSPERGYYFEEPRESIGHVRSFHGNFLVCVKAYAYLLRLGWRGLREAAMTSVLASNYLLSRVTKLPGVTLPHDPSKPRKHEFVVSLLRLMREHGISAREFAKALIDYGVHPPTIYFPQTVDEAVMIEPTETEPKRELDRYVESMGDAIERVKLSKETLNELPRYSSVRRINEPMANHPKHIRLSWRASKGGRIDESRSLDKHS